MVSSSVILANSRSKSKSSTSVLAQLPMDGTEADVGPTGVLHGEIEICSASSSPDLRINTKPLLCHRAHNATSANVLGWLFRSHRKTQSRSGSPGAATDVANASKSAVASREPRLSNGSCSFEALIWSGIGSKHKRSYMNTRT